MWLKSSWTVVFRYLVSIFDVYILWGNDFFSYSVDVAYCDLIKAWQKINRAKWRTNHLLLAHCTCPVSTSSVHTLFLTTESSKTHCLRSKENLKENLRQPVIYFEVFNLINSILIYSNIWMFNLKWILFCAVDCHEVFGTCTNFYIILLFFYLQLKIKLTISDGNFIMRCIDCCIRQQQGDTWR